MTLQCRLKKIGEMFAAVTTAYHYWRTMLPSPYLIWAEDGAEDFSADNRHAEQRFTGTADYFTKQEFDSTIDAIQRAMDEAAVSYTLENVQYEEETNLIHYTWRWWA